MYHLGLPQDEWANTAELLNKIRQIPGSVVKTIVDENDEVSLIFIQLREQRELYQKYGEMIQIDGTYKVVKVAMPLYSVVVEDNFGVGQPVGYMFVRDENAENIKAALKIFAEVTTIMNARNSLSAKVMLDLFFCSTTTS